MKGKLGWILFCVALVVVVILGAVLINNGAKWKSGDELMDIAIEDVDTAYIRHTITATDTPTTEEYQLSGGDIQYILQEFSASKFEKSKERNDAGSSQVVFNMKDGTQVSFSICGDVLTVEGKSYKCHSYLVKFVSTYGREE